MLWKGDERHPLLPESKRRRAEFRVSYRIVRNAVLFGAVVVRIIFLLRLVWRDVCADCCGVAPFSARILPYSESSVFVFLVRTPSSPL